MATWSAQQVESLGLLLGLAFFFGLSFEGFYWRAARSRPGGVRTFPLISLAGALLYALEPDHATAFCVGLLVLGIWLYPYYRAQVSAGGQEPAVADGIMVPLCNVVAYLLGPVTLTQPPWLAIAVTVAAVLLLRAREPLHLLAERIPGREIVTLAQFLVLIGVVLPLLPREPVTQLTPITPFQVWLAAVLVSTLSYASYLLQRVLPVRDSVMLTAVLGGLYSSTVTTVVLARRLRDDPGNRHELTTGIVLASALMYVRLELVVAIFDRALAARLAPPLAVLAAAAMLLALLTHRRSAAAGGGDAPPPTLQNNPLELPAALMFAGLFVLVSVASAWVKTQFGHPGLFLLAALVGVTDIDPFVLSIAQGSVAGLGATAAAVAILLAASSNSGLKALYALGFAGWRRSAGAALALVALGLAGGGLAALLARAGLAG